MADAKGKASGVFYLLGIGLCFVHPWLGDLMYVVVALLWLVPDRRMEAHLAAPTSPE
ncbi:MAG: hypothetical protein ACYCW6_07115 [Candidatus Xenobia bacterium]